MKKRYQMGTDELRPEYKRSDFGELVRGKHSAKIAKETNIVVLEREIAKVFPNDKSVNDALRSLLKISEHTCLTPVSG